MISDYGVGRAFQVRPQRISEELELNKFREKNRERGKQLGPRKRLLQLIHEGVLINDAIDQVIEEWNGHYKREQLLAWIVEEKNRNKKKNITINNSNKLKSAREDDDGR